MGFRKRFTAYLWTTLCGLVAPGPPHRPPRPAWRRTPTSSASPARRQYKDALVPRRFSNNSLPPFCPPHSSPSCTAPTGRASGRTELHLLSAAPLPPLLPTAPIRD